MPTSGLSEPRKPTPAMFSAGLAPGLIIRSSGCTTKNDTRAAAAAAPTWPNMSTVSSHMPGASAWTASRLGPAIPDVTTIRCVGRSGNPRPETRPPIDSSVRRVRHAISDPVSVAEACPPIFASSVRTRSKSFVRFTLNPPYGIVISATRSRGVSAARKRSTAALSGGSRPGRNESFSIAMTNVRPASAAALLPNGGGTGVTLAAPSAGGASATGIHSSHFTGRARPSIRSWTSSDFNPRNGWPSLDVA